MILDTIDICSWGLAWKCYFMDW